MIFSQPKPLLDPTTIKGRRPNSLSLSLVGDGQPRLLGSSLSSRTQLEPNSSLCTTNDHPRPMH
jgi:hypothetical protein